MVFIKLCRYTQMILFKLYEIGNVIRVKIIR